MFKMVSESMLANVIAFEEAGVPLKKLKQAVGRDGGTVTGSGVVLQTPIQGRLSEEDARLLIKTYSGLLSSYGADQLKYERINSIRLRNNVPAKVSMIRGVLRTQGSK
jgi:hypothetical protein